MQKKIQKLEEELQKKDRMYKDLQEKSSVAPQEVPQFISAQQSTSQTIQKPHEQKVDDLIDETESEAEDVGCDSVRVSSKPSPLHFGENMQMKKQTSLTPVHQANKTFEQADKKLIIKIEGVSDERPVSQQDSSSIKDEKPEVNSVMSSSVQASEFVKTPKVQSLIRQIINLKASHRNNQQSNFKMDQPQITEKQIEEKQREIQSDQAALTQRIKDMIDSSMIFSQLKNQPAKLLRRKNELAEQEKQLKQQLQILDENYQMTLNYIHSEESTQRVNQDQIQQLDTKIKNDLAQLRQMKDSYCNQTKSSSQ